MKKDTQAIRIDVVTGIEKIPEASWNACAGPDNPFVSYRFLRALEESQSATAATGWQPVHLMLSDDEGRVRGFMPNYRKSHSYGEYVFDHGWADAYGHSAYYPKLQSAVPFSPVPGPRLLVQDPSDAPTLLSGLERVCGAWGLSSAHITFLEPDQLPLFDNTAWLLRQGEQFHWFNRGYTGFEDFLQALSSRKRKMIRKERQTALAPGITLVHVQGPDITTDHWNIFWHFYQDTSARKWGQPYLTRDFFTQLSATMPEQLLLILAYRDGRAIAGALNIIGTHCLYGRYWGCVEDHPFLHFEVCYYQAIDYAIAHKLARVEAGAQGMHKLLRGYEPVATWSAHYIAHTAFRDAVARFLEQERQRVQAQIIELDQRTPFKREDFA